MTPSTAARRLCCLFTVLLLLPVGPGPGADDGTHDGELWGTVAFSVGQLSLTLSLNQTSFRPGERLLASAVLANGGPEEFVDVYLGMVLPSALAPGLGCTTSNAIAFFADAFTRTVMSCISAPVATFPPLLRGLHIQAGLPPTSFANFFGLDWPASAPAGTYAMVLVLTPADALSDGVLDPGDVLIARQAFTGLP
jgi:hypothetical protein